MQHIRSLILPFVAHKVLIPDTVISEIIKTDFEPIDNLNSEYLGDLSWRDYTMPVVSIERLAGEHIAYENSSNIIAIVKVVIEDKTFDNFGVMLTNFPKTAKVGETDISFIDEKAEDVFCYDIALRGEKMNMFNLEQLQGRIIAKLK